MWQLVNDCPRIFQRHLSEVQRRFKEDGRIRYRQAQARVEQCEVKWCDRVVVGPLAQVRPRMQDDGRGGQLMGACAAKTWRDLFSGVQRP